MFDAEKEIGGQFNIAKQIPGKEEFFETIRYFKKQLEIHNVKVLLNTYIDKDTPMEEFDEVILATGISPRIPNIEGINHAKARWSESCCNWSWRYRF